ncbi:glycoside hydrolase family 32 protein [Paenibacillus beijingensis]|uniref:Sucrose-6-phosphate hydrolase n=1 Tax=Paenibacillus beijingensis TaxID=1126833 RepID=A0A0D5NQA0_9BACL|nr:glycoside hydrolase family 32 protein [Paenibacillus beijingensis]AJY77350.1 sucrose-6-phosphate hydrolase [Paenibacillus beijingensis]
MSFTAKNRTPHREALLKAEQSIAKIKDAVSRDLTRLKYHFMAPAYWINDPNGLIFYKGEYHLFYQHYPYGAEWGSMHWGHAKSKDLVHWEHLPIALAPSEPYDLHERGGCFSGSAVDDNGVLSVLYTGTIIQEDGTVIQSQCLATSEDGITFQKYDGNPVISVPPEDGSAAFRDPKVWKHDDTWYMVVGSQKGDIGKALLYRSPDLRKWDYAGVLAESDGTMGYMWECPDFFPLGDRHVLMFSPMGMGQHKTIYLVGDMDYTTGRFDWDTMGDVDLGFEYYAPQSFLDGQGRRIIIAWLNAWDWMPWFKNFGPTGKNDWCGAMSLPRVVELDKDGRLKFTPVEELEVLRRDSYHQEALVVRPGVRTLPDYVGSDCLEIKVEFNLDGSSAEEVGFVLRAARDRSEQTLLVYNRAANELRFDRTKADGWSEGIQTARLERSGSDPLRLHIFVDTSVIEVYADDYRTVMTNNIYPDPANVDLDIFAAGGSVTVNAVDIWKLLSAW